jgi:hypothetical protein
MRTVQDETGDPPMTEAAATRPQPIAGYASFLIGASALIIVLVSFWAGPFAPQQRASVSIGQTAAEIRQSAIRAMKGEKQPAPKAAPWTTDRKVKAGTAVLAALSVIIGLFGLIRRESWRPAGAGIVLGVSAVTVQMFIWAILLVVGALILVAIIQNLDGILGS